MSVFSYHLVKTSFFSALKLLLFPPLPKNTPGLVHAETMACMTLGSPVFSLSRILVKQVAVFAQWENEAAIDTFLKKSKTGKTLSEGWHIRLTFLRQWGKISGFKIPMETQETEFADSPVVAVTLARMKLPEIPRFLHWGRPVEKLVRDHPGTTLSLASIRFPRLVSTFSIWRSLKEMTDMVQGHSSVPRPKRHVDAMKERDRKDFHFEFTTLRFRPISEFGEWKGQKGFIPNNLKKKN
jgi:hypothetical protein